MGGKNQDLDPHFALSQAPDEAVRR